MKRILTMVFIILLLVSFVGCDTGENNNGYQEIYTQNDTNETIDPNHPAVGDITFSPVEEILEFTSLLDFLETHRAYVMGRRLFGARTHLIERANFAGLEQIYLPVGIPETYRLYRIYVGDDGMSFWYMPEENLVSRRSRTSAMAYRRDFTVSITRWNLEDPKGAMMGQLRGVSVHDLIDGRYYFDEWHLIEWTTDTERVWMYIPRTTRNAQGEFEIGDETTGIITLRREEIPQLAQMQVLDLTNFAEVDALIETLPPSHYQLTFDMGTTPIGAYSIDVPVFANLRFFLHDNYYDLTATPVKEGHTFLGWYLDAGFTMPLASRDEYLMPMRDITLYARWE